MYGGVLCGSGRVGLESGFLLRLYNAPPPVVPSLPFLFSHLRAQLLGLVGSAVQETQESARGFVEPALLTSFQIKSKDS